MNDDQSQSTATPTWFWILGGIAVAWNLMGLMAFAAQMMMTEEALAALPEEQQEIYKNLPAWINIFFAIAVIGGTTGAILLMMKNRFAVPVLGISLVGVLVQYGHMFFMTDTPSVMGAGAIVLPVLVVLISIALIPYAVFCKGKGLLS